MTLLLLPFRWARIERDAATQHRTQFVFAPTNRRDDLCILIVFRSYTHAIQRWIWFNLCEIRIKVNVRESDHLELKMEKKKQKESLKLVLTLFVADVWVYLQIVIVTNTGWVHTVHTHETISTRRWKMHTENEMKWYKANDTIFLCHFVSAHNSCSPLYIKKRINRHSRRRRRRSGSLNNNNNKATTKKNIVWFWFCLRLRLGIW